MGKEKAEVREVDHDEKAVIEQTEEPTDTTRDADEGGDSVASDTSNADSDGAGYDRENTMDAVSEVRKADDRNRG
ncbi:hypothetical protein AAVH_02597 [Aphelenchoides avenae]|nr:hypothetical protein AAVH_02597 [Aphelenchus avenae]